MTFTEAVGYRLQRPGFLLVLPGRHVLDFSNTQMLVQAGKRSFDYARLGVADVLAVTWEVWTPDQLQNIIKESMQSE